jgi:hypothetical protein
MHATDLVGINGITRVLLAYTCQQGVYPRGHVLPPSLPLIIYARVISFVINVGLGLLDY